MRAHVVLHHLSSACGHHPGACEDDTAAKRMWMGDGRMSHLSGACEVFFMKNRWRIGVPGACGSAHAPGSKVRAHVPPGLSEFSHFPCQKSWRM